MKRSEINDYIKKNYQGVSDKDLSKKCGISVNAVQCRRFDMNLHRDDNVDAAAAVVYEKQLKRSNRERRQESKKKDILIEENESLRLELDAALQVLGGVSSHKISEGLKLNGEATMVAVASDWHVEENVKGEAVNDMNEYDLSISRKRADHFFRTVHKLCEIEGKHTKIKNLIIALLGDFISGHIHEELMETTELEPTEAIIRAQEYIISGIEYLLKNTPYKITIVCHSGNHGRITKYVHYSTEHGNSLEYMMYKSIASYFRNEKRIDFIIPNAYHSYIDIYGRTLRLHHGHAIKFGGGVGGITIPVNKAIAQWNRTRRADIDVFGHFHQAYDGGNFIANGSMIGYNAYAIAIKASYERPAQIMFGIHSKLGHYVTRRIYFENA